MARRKYTPEVGDTLYVTAEHRYRERGDVLVKREYVVLDCEVRQVNLYKDCNLHPDMDLVVNIETSRKYNHEVPYVFDLRLSAIDKDRVYTTPAGAARECKALSDDWDDKHEKYGDPPIRRDWVHLLEDKPEPELEPEKPAEQMSLF